MSAYEESLKIYRDLKNTFDTSHKDGKSEGKIEGRKEQKDEGIINALEMGMFSVEVIAQLFKESVEYILKVKKENNL